MNVPIGSHFYLLEIDMLQSQLHCGRLKTRNHSFNTVHFSTNVKMQGNIFFKNVSVLFFFSTFSWYFSGKMLSPLYTSNRKICWIVKNNEIFFVKVLINKNCTVHNKNCKNGSITTKEWEKYCSVFVSDDLIQRTNCTSHKI